MDQLLVQIQDYMRHQRDTGAFQTLMLEFINQSLDDQHLLLLKSVISHVPSNYWTGIESLVFKRLLELQILECLKVWTNKHLDFDLYLQSTPNNPIMLKLWIHLIRNNDLVPFKWQLLWPVLRAMPASSDTHLLQNMLLEKRICSQYDFDSHLEFIQNQLEPQILFYIQQTNKWLSSDLDPKQQQELSQVIELVPKHLSDSFLRMMEEGKLDKSLIDKMDLETLKQLLDAIYLKPGKIHMCQLVLESLWSRDPTSLQTLLGSLPYMDSSQVQIEKVIQLIAITGKSAGCFGWLPEILMPWMSQDHFIQLFPSHNYTGGSKYDPLITMDCISVFEDFPIQAFDSMHSIFDHPNADKMISQLTKILQSNTMIHISRLMDAPIQLDSKIKVLKGSISKDLVLMTNIWTKLYHDEQQTLEGTKQLLVLLPNIYAASPPEHLLLSKIKDQIGFDLDWFARLREFSLLSEWIPLYFNQRLSDQILNDNWRDVQLFLKTLNPKDAIKILSQIVIVLNRTRLLFQGLQLILEYGATEDTLTRAVAFRALVQFQKRDPQQLWPEMLLQLVLWACREIARPRLLKTLAYLMNVKLDHLAKTYNHHVVPVLVYEKRYDILDTLAQLQAMQTRNLLVDCSGPVVGHLLMHCDDYKQELLLFVQKLDVGPLPFSKLFRLSPLDLVFSLVKYLSSDLKQKAITCLGIVEESQDRKPSSDFLLQYSLGLLSMMTDRIQDIILTGTQEKMNLLCALEQLIILIGSPISSVSPPLMALLQHTLSQKQLRSMTLQVWGTFVKTLHVDSMASSMVQMCAILMAVYPDSTPSQQNLIMGIISFMVIDNASTTQSFFARLPELPQTMEWSRLHACIAKHMKKSLTIWSRIDDLMHNLTNDNLILLQNTLQSLKKLLIDNQQQVQQAFLDENTTLKHLMEHLFKMCSRYQSLEPQLSSKAADVIGILGAVDPQRMDIKLQQSGAFGPEIDLESDADMFLFMTCLIEQHLAPSFKSANNGKRQGHLAYCIQELLRLCGFYPELFQTGHENKKLKTEKDPKSLLKRWSEFPKAVILVIEPLLNSRYSVGHIPAPVLQMKHPIYTNTQTWIGWLTGWALNLIQRIRNPTTRNLFQLFMHLIHEQDDVLTRILLPHIFLTVVVEGNQVNAKELLEECMCVLERDLPDERHHIVLEMVFQLIDHLSEWSRHRKIQINKQKQQRRNQDKTKIAEMEKRIEQLESFLQLIPQLVLGNASLRVGAYPRALMHFDKHIRVLRNKSTPEEMQPLYEQLQKIYCHLGDADALEGLYTMLINPDIEQQLLHHTSTGKWTIAQSSYEAMLRQSDSPETRMGLLDCLKNLGHYESLLTHVNGLIARDPSKAVDCYPYAVSSSWRLSNWQLLGEWLKKDQSDHFETVLGRLLFKMHHNQPLDALLQETRLKLSALLAASVDYTRTYSITLHLSMLHEVEQFEQLRKNGTISELMERWNERLETMSSVFKNRELVLSLRLALLSLEGKQEQYQASVLVQMAREARKSKHYATSYATILLAKQMQPSLAAVELAKLSWYQGMRHEAMMELRTAPVAVFPKCFRRSFSKSCDEEQSKALAAAKKSLLLTRWMEETGGQNSTALINAYLQVSKSFPNWEKGEFYLGRYYSRLYNVEVERAKTTKSNSAMAQASNLGYLVCKQYAKCLAIGTKYLYEVLPRLLTIWMDMGSQCYDLKREIPSLQDSDERVSKFQITSRLVRKLLEKVPTFIFLTAVPQMVSRISHKHSEVHQILETILVRVLSIYPQQSVWHLISVAKSTIQTRSRRVQSIFTKIRTDPSATHSQAGELVQQIQKLAEQLQILCKHPAGKSDSQMSISRDMRPLQRMTPLDLIIPLQSSMHIVPSRLNGQQSPFPPNMPLIHSFKDEIEVMNSLQRPKKITINGSDGKGYIFLCKPEDDLRKDSRLMELNMIINRLFKRNTEARKRGLKIRTYAVVPLNEKCGLIEWVSNMNAFRQILLKLYRNRNQQTSHTQIREWMSKPGFTELQAFTELVLPKHPPVFHEWFLETFPEPCQWLESRNRYIATSAAMSMVGYVVGLGDRHGENILFDETTGECLHVDLNCLFEKGLEFEKPEKVPFRLTRNMVDAFGISGVEGSFRKACQVSLQVLRDNRDSLMSVLETFLHDPLCEWSRSKHQSQVTKEEAGEQESQKAVKILGVIDRKLQGYVIPAGLPVSVEGQVYELINTATDLKNLSQMYIGWAAYL
ncbi:hypothetical protein EDD86DRAFT_210343, partial [Gorgonomyces haynaldii]